MTNQNPPDIDPRPLFTRAMDQAERLVAKVEPAQLDLPTPCTEYDVRNLLGHVVAVLRRIAHVAGGGAPFDVPQVIEDVPDDGWSPAYADGRARVEAAWADDAVLDRVLTLPWGTMPGRVALMAYVQELTVHAWDLAQATGRLAELDPELGAASLQIAQRFLPAEPRGGHIPFGPVVAVADDADVYTRLAAHLGRDSTSPA